MILMILNIILVKKTDLKNIFNSIKPPSGGFFMALFRIIIFGWRAWRSPLKKNQ
jgi:hypothetical protein